MLKLLAKISLGVVALFTTFSLFSGPISFSLKVALASSTDTSGVPKAQLNEFNQNGMNINSVFSSYTSGDPNILIAYIEGGINLHDSGFVKNVDSSLYVNWHELPVPCEGTSISTATMIVGGKTVPCSILYSSSKSDYNPDGSGVINALQWANDPRVKDSNGNGIIDPEDLIVAFSNNVNNDEDGFPNDIFGWDFYENQNDPATDDSAYGHANGQMSVIHSICPKCMIMPIRAGDEALDQTQNLAQAWTYACSQGANIVVSVTADLGYSNGMLQAINYCNSKGVAMFESSTDFDSQDHQGGMHWPFVIPGNGAVSDLTGLPSSYTNSIANSYWTRSDLTSWGPKNLFTVATGGGSTSESTPTIGALFGLIESYGLSAYRNSKIPAPLTGQQVLQILRLTATPFQDPKLPWPGAPGAWNPQYGYGLPNVLAAVTMVDQGNIPPSVQITSPNWYQMFDPTNTSGIEVDGTIVPGSAQTNSYTWTLQAGFGPNPNNFITVGTGSASGNYSGPLGTVQSNQIPQSLYNQAMALSSDKEVSTADQYDVTFVVTVTDGAGLTGVDRRTVEAIHDSSELPGFPLYMGASGESEPALVDLQGTGKLDIVYADADGFVHAIDPSTGKELPGWPFHTNPLTTLGNYTQVNFGYQPILTPVAVGDLFHTGNLDVVVSTLDGYVYAISSQGQLISGWPKLVNRGVSSLPIPRPSTPYTRNPIQGTVAPPVLFDLSGNGMLDVIQAGLDGYIHVWDPNGQDVPGWPVKVSLPSNFSIRKGYTLINDQRIVSPPTVAFLFGKSAGPCIVVRSQFTEISGAGIQALPLSISFAYSVSGSLLPNWPVALQGLVEYYGSAMDALTEGVSDPIAVDPNNSGTDDVIIEPLWTPPYMVDGNGQIVTQLGSLGAAGAALLSVQQNPVIALNPSQWSSNPPIPFDDYGAIGNINGTLSYVTSGSGATSFASALLVPGSGNAIDDFAMSYSLSNGQSLSNFPVPQQGTEFLGGPIVADLSGSGQPDVVVGSDASALMAFNSQGSQVLGFPKFTGGWMTFSPAAGDLFSTGHTDLVATTRDGYLLAFQTQGLDSGNNQWWRSLSNEWNSDSYGIDSRSPGIIRFPSWPSNGNIIAFIAPGNDWYAGQVDHYSVTFYPGGAVQNIPATVSAGQTQFIEVPSGYTKATIQAVDANGNLGMAETVSIGQLSSQTENFIPPSNQSSQSLVPNALSAVTGSTYPAQIELGVLGIFLGLALLIYTIRRSPKS